MTVSTEISTVTYNGDGVVISFPVIFPFITNDEIRVILRDSLGVETTWVENTEYTLIGAGDPTGTLTVKTAPVDHTPLSGETLTILRNMNFTQDTDYTEGDPFPASAHELALDKLTMIAQQLGSGTDRVVRFSSTVTDNPNLELNELALTRKNKTFQFNGTGDELQLVAPLAGSTILNEDDLASDSDTRAPSQSSVKAYVDNRGRPRKNFIINGGFSIWQEGTSFSCPVGTDTYTADMHIFNPVTSGAATVTRVANALSTGGKYMLSMSTGTGDILKKTRIESINSAPLRDVITYSVLIKNNGATSYAPVLVIQSADAADDFSSVTIIENTQLQTLAPGETKRVYATIDLSSISSVVNGVQIQLTIRDDADLVEEQLEIGSVRTDFDIVDYATELTRCQFYYETLKYPNTNDRIAVGQWYSSTNLWALLHFSKKRVTPTITSSGNYIVTSASGGGNAVSGISFDNMTTIATNIACVSFGGVNGDATHLTSGSSGATIYLDARLY